MPRKIENPLTDGLASKIYLAAFPEPKQAKELARKIFGGDLRNVTGEIYRAVEPWDDLEHKKFPLANKKEIYFKRPVIGTGPDTIYLIFSNIEPFLRVLKQKIDGLTFEEERKLETFLDGDFRGCVRDLVLSNISFSANINAQIELEDMLYQLCFLAKMTKEVNNHLDMVDKKYPNIPENRKKDIRKAFFNIIVSSETEKLYFYVEKCFEALPFTLIEKIVKARIGHPSVRSTCGYFAAVWKLLTSNSFRGSWERIGRQLTNMLFKTTKKV